MKLFDPSLAAFLGDTTTDPRELPGDLEGVGADLTPRNRAILCHVLRHPGDSHEAIAEALGLSRSTVTRRLNSEPLRAAIAASYQRMVQVVEVEARRVYLRAFERFIEIFDPAGRARHSDVIRAFAELRGMLAAADSRGAAVGLPYKCESCGRSQDDKHGEEQDPET